MKKLLSLIAMGLLASSLYAGIDGKWRAELQAPQGKAKPEGKRTLTTTFDLKADGNALTGKVTASGGKRRRSFEIQNGKVEGDKFSFTTLIQTKKGETKLIWEGTVSGDELKGTRSRVGGKRGQDFTAKRQ